MPEQIRYPIIAQRTLEVLRDADAPLRPREAVARIGERLQPTPYESETIASGGGRWQTVLGYVSGMAVTVGWMSKTGGWSITDAGAAALDSFRSPEELKDELDRLYVQYDERRKKALEALSEDHQFIATTLELVAAGSWTAYDDLAELQTFNS